jgi:hypothetical protein
MHRLIVALAALGASTDALACGGFFCQSLAQPVDQAGERILFVVDEAAQQVEVQVQITYTGTAEGFAWLLPTPTEPTIGTSVDDVFRLLGNATFPIWQLQRETEGTCKGSGKGGLAFPTDDADFDSDTPDAGGGQGVSVVSQALVGPYESVVLQADDGAVLVDWLQEHQYYVPDDVGPKLAPYTATSSYFVALRLQKEKTTGDLVPVSVTYPGTTPVIPLQLTAVAAQPDMPLQPFVLGSARAVPDNYLHVNVNPFAIDWINAGANYFSVITRAADEAGGQGFATDFAGPTDGLQGMFAAQGMYRPDDLRGLTDAWEVLQAMASAGFPLSAGTLPLADALLDPALGEGTTLQSELAALGYLGYRVQDELQGRDIDGDALADALIAGWLPAMEHAEALVNEHPMLTRLTSSISAEEMSVDPQFVLNPDMAGVPRQRDATLVTHCNPTVTGSDAPRSLRLPDGREMWYPAEAFTDPSFDWAAWLASAQANATETIERTSASGEPELIDAALAALERDRCGCDQGGSGLVTAGGLLALALRRRRSAR